MILHLDLSTGASGDKLWGALLELCEQQGLISFAELVAKAQQLLPHVELKREKVIRNGIAATHITVDEQRDAHEEHSSHAAHTHPHHRHAAYRQWEDIQELIVHAAEQTIISAAAAERATLAFTRVAEAEAKVHDVEPEQVHFHEIGAADSIIDIVFNSFLLDLLQPSAVYVTPLALGQGTFICEHGELPVPAPATAEIIARSTVPVYASSHQGELTTPTGAALIAEFITACAPLPCSRPLAIGYGAGSREITGAANVLRAIYAESTPLTGLEIHADEQLYVEGVIQLACNLDHLSAETIAFACEELLADEDTLEVWQECITMKKGRLATKLMVLTTPERSTRLSRKIIELTGTLGVRSAYLERTIVPRTVLMLDTPYGPVPFKAAETGSPADRSYWLRPEHDAVARLAREQHLNYGDVYAELQALAGAHRSTHR